MNKGAPAAASIDLEAYKPAQIAERVELAGVAKASLGTRQTVMLGVLAGAFIAFGAMLFTLVMTEHGLGFGPARLLGGAAFSLGLILVVIAGAELFTGNNLIVMAWVDKRVGTTALARNWGLVYLGNLIGSVGAGLLMALSGSLDMADGQVLQTANAIAQGKATMPLSEAFFRSILCNILVCLAVWLTFAARDVTGKILAIIPPIAAFVALGFEHSIANMYFFAVAALASPDIPAVGGMIGNLIVVTIGNIVEGAGGVGLTYWACYRMR